MILKKLGHLTLAFVIILCVNGQLENRSKRFQFPSNGVTQVSLNGLITNISDPMVVSTRNWLHWIGRSSANEDFDIVELYDSPLMAVSPATAKPTHSVNSAYKPRSKREKVCKPTITTCDCMELCSGDLIFEDNFNELNLTHWHREIRIASHSGDNNFVSYQGRAENCFVNHQENMLHIVPTLLSETPGYSAKTFLRGGVLDLKENCTANDLKRCIHVGGTSNMLPPVVSARIRTKNSFQFRYGRVEVRAKLPKGDWIFPLIQLEPVHEIYGPDLASGKLIVALARGNRQLFDSIGNNIDGTLLMGGAVVTKDPKYRNIRLSTSSHLDHLGNDFHVYTLIWTDNRISVKIDGNEYGTISGEFYKLKTLRNITHAANYEKGTYMAPFDQEFYLTLGVSVGGRAYFPDNSTTVMNSLNHTKPWTNSHANSKIKFWKAKGQWKPTWKDDVDLVVDYVRVYAL